MQALVRELREELNVQIVPPEGASLLTLRQPGVLLDVWRVDEWAGDIINAAPDEHDAIGWFTVEAASKLDLADQEYRGLFENVVSR